LSRDWPRAAVERRFPWRSTFATIALAGLAAFAGVYLGAEHAAPRGQPLAERIFELIGDEQELTPQQRETIQAIGARYAPVREALREKSRALNAELLGLMSEEQRFGPRTEARLAELQLVMGERLKLSMEYMLEVRGELTVAQRERFQRNLASEAIESR
jgi:nickel and cobalt resistance protein CnrR